MRTNSADSNISSLSESSGGADSPLAAGAAAAESTFASLAAEHERLSVRAEGGDAALQRLNASLLAALKAERARSHALLDRLKEQQSDEQQPQQQPPSVAKASSFDSASTAATVRPASAPRARGPLRRTLSAFAPGADENAAENKPPSATANKVVPKKPPKRSRILIDPLGAPLKAGSLIDNPTAAPPPASASPTAEEAAPVSALTNPSPSPQSSKTRRRVSTSMAWRQGWRVRK